MFHPHFIDTELHRFSDVESACIEKICNNVEPELRERLPGVAEFVHLLVEPGVRVIAETGEVGFAMAPHLIRWTVDPSRSVVETASEHLRAALS